MKRNAPAPVGWSAIVRPLHKVNQHLNLSGNNLTAIACIVVYVFWQQMTEVSAQSFESLPSDKISIKLGSVSSQVLEVRNVCRIGLRCVPSRNSLNIGKPSAKKSAKVVASVSGLAVQSQPMNNNSSENAASSKNGEDNGNCIIHWRWFVLRIYRRLIYGGVAGASMEDMGFGISHMV